MQQGWANLPLATSQAQIARGQLIPQSRKVQGLPKLLSWWALLAQLGVFSFLTDMPALLLSPLLQASLCLWQMLHSGLDTAMLPSLQTVPSPDGRSGEWAVNGAMKSLLRYPVSF